jgi:branched-chain amino acid transport system permease protein
MWEQQVVNGLTSGVIYALLGMGFSLVWATARTVNFAYGAVYALGAYVLYSVFRAAAADQDIAIQVLVAGFVGVAVVGAVLGYALEVGVFRRLRGNELTPFFASLGIAIAIESAIVLLFGSRSLVFVVSGTREFFEVGPVAVTMTQLVVIAASVTIMIVLHLLLMRTRLGRAMRATSFDAGAAQLMGISVNQVIAGIFIISTVIGAWTGAFVGLFYGRIDPYMGAAVLIKGLAAAILGGFGNIPGAIVGGLVIGLLQSVGASFATSGNWQDVIAYSILILVILIRPHGIFGERGREHE